MVRGVRRGLADPNPNQTGFQAYNPKQSNPKPYPNLTLTLTLTRCAPALLRRIVRPMRRLGLRLT